MNHEHLFVAPQAVPSSRVVEIDNAIFDLNDIVAIKERGAESTIVYLRNMSARLDFCDIPYEKFKELIGANPQKLEITDEA